MENTTVTVIANVVDKKNNHCSAVLRFKPQGKKAFEKRVDLADINKHQKMCDLLRNSGVEVPTDYKKASQFLDQHILIPQKNAPTKTLQDQTGWFGDDQFVLKHKTVSLCKSNVVHIDRYTGSDVAASATERSLDEWQKSLGLITRYSAIGIFIMAHAFSGPLLKHLLSGPDQPLFNLRQETSCGKTSLLLLAHTIFGPIRDASELFTFDLTKRALEEILMGHNDLFAAFDEENRSDGADGSGGSDTVTRAFGFVAAGGRGRRRSSSVGDTLPEASWRCAIATSSNRKIASTPDENESNTPTGVRWIDILVGNSDDGGIFDSSSCDFTASKRSQQLDRAIAGCLAHQGTAGASWLKILVDGKKRATILASAKAAQVKFKKLHSASLSAAQQRILSKFSLVYAMASLLPDTGLVPWSQQKGETAVSDVYRCYVKERQSEYRDKSAMLRKLHTAMTDAARFPTHSRAARLWQKQHLKSDGFNTTFKNEDIVCVFDHTFTKLSQELDVSIADLRAILREKKILMQDANKK